MLPIKHDEKNLPKPIVTPFVCRTAVRAPDSFRHPTIADVKDKPHAQLGHDQPRNRKQRLFLALLALVLDHPSAGRLAGTVLQYLPFFHHECLCLMTTVDMSTTEM